MAAQPPARPDSIQVTATAHASNGRWRVSLVGAPDIGVDVDRLAEVDAAVTARLSGDLGRDDIRTVVHIRWYDADHPLPWPSWLHAEDDDPDPDAGAGALDMRRSGEAGPT
jgi:hypothetical protein